MGRLAAAELCINQLSHLAPGMNNLALSVPAKHSDEITLIPIGISSQRLNRPVGRGRGTSTIFDTAVVDRYRGASSA
jgi:hypothetical protein